jgi:hypothetical protein
MDIGIRADELGIYLSVSGYYCVVAGWYRLQPWRHWTCPGAFLHGRADNFIPNWVFFGSWFNYGEHKLARGTTNNTTTLNVLRDRKLPILSVPLAHHLSLDFSNSDLYTVGWITASKSRKLFLVFLPATLKRHSQQKLSWHYQKKLRHSQQKLILCKHWVNFKPRLAPPSPT